MALTKKVFGVQSVSKKFYRKYEGPKLFFLSKNAIFCVPKKYRFWCPERVKKVPYFWFYSRILLEIRQYFVIFRDFGNAASPQGYNFVELCGRLGGTWDPHIGNFWNFLPFYTTLNFFILLFF